MSKRKKILVIMVGTDDRPADQSHIDQLQISLAGTKKIKDALTIVAHHAIAFKKIKRSTKKKVLVVKVGDESRPANTRAIESVKALFEQAEKDNTLTVITGYPLSFEYIKRKKLKKIRSINIPDTNIVCTTRGFAESSIGYPVPVPYPYRESLVGTGTATMGLTTAESKPSRPRTFGPRTFVIINK